MITAQWEEVLRLAASIRHGTVTASLIIRKLASYPRQNSLHARRAKRNEVVDTVSAELSHVVEVDGGMIYPTQEKIMAFRGFECRVNGKTPAEYLSGRESVKITLYAYPTPIIKGQTEMLPIRKSSKRVSQ